MKKLSIILISALVAMLSCTKSKEVHPEIGDGNDEIVTVGIKDVHVEYTRTDHAELNRVIFHYCPADANGNAQQFDAAEMTKKETFFELVLDELLCDTLYWYYYELFPNSGDAFNTVQKTFHTQACDTPEPPEPPTPPSGTPEGAINGLFTINENGDQVYFSQGNLQYQASTNTWRFAENQWNFVGGNDNVNGNEYGNVYENGVKCSNNNISATYNGWIDLFGWGTSGWNNGNLYYRPYDSERVFNPEMGYGYGPTDGIHCTFDLSGDYANADWGVYNAISNGGDMPNQWRTPTLSELKYVFDDRTTASNIRYAKAVVNEIAGVVLLPDGWNASIYSLNNPNVSEAPFAGNAISASDWEKMETNGAVFFPVNGQRVGTSYNSYDYADGRYWSSTAIPNAGQQPYLMSFNPNYVAPQSAGISKDTGISVRLVQDANP